jgi:hypothetical protein
MDAITLSAKFAAYTWFTECARGSDAAHDEAARFTSENWEHFLNHAHKGWGRLLARVARPAKVRRSRRVMASH